MPGKFDRVKPGQPFGIVGRGGALTLDAPAAKFMNSLLAELRRLGKWSAAAPLALRDGPEGRSMSLNLPRTIMGTLSGASSPYDLVEQLGASGGTWTSSGGGVSCSACAYEVNSRAGLSGKTVELVNVGKGDWRFYYVSGTGCSNFQVTVQGCGGSGAISGASVTIGSDTETTNGSGVATFTSVSKGASISVSATNWCTKTGTVPSNCTNQTISMFPATGRMVADGVNIAIPSSVTLSWPGPPSGSTTLSLGATQTSGGCSQGAIWCGTGGPGGFPVVVIWCTCGGFLMGSNATCTGLATELSNALIANCGGSCLYAGIATSGSPLNVSFSVIQGGGCITPSDTYTLTP